MQWYLGPLDVLLCEVCEVSHNKSRTSLGGKDRRSRRLNHALVIPSLSCCVSSLTVVESFFLYCTCTFRSQPCKSYVHISQLVLEDRCSVTLTSE